MLDALHDERLSRDAVGAVLRLLDEAQSCLHLDQASACQHLAQALAILRQEPHPTRAPGGLAGWQRRRLTDFIDDHLSSPIRTTQLAAALGLSVSHFSHAFKQSFGVTPLVYIAQRRIDSARQAMLDSRLSLTEIAHSHGFCDQSHFSRTFRRETGVTPQTWRRLRGLEPATAQPAANDLSRPA
ncbi:helix-turn-helix transcriptional regulator [Pseudomonas sp.]|uniref:helix-turn-helix transcriptional regulator n=1 Tax=Pseudomonas sp. TaxID=306 RepID=UPI003D129F6D